jgi:hypothetical protein
MLARPSIPAQILVAALERERKFPRAAGWYVAGVEEVVAGGSHV